MAFNRTVSLIIGDGSATAVKNTGVEVSTLDIEFDITRSRTFEENTATFAVYNLAVETRESFMKKGAAVIFSAGYEDEGDGTIFIGAISEIKETQQGGDLKTEFQAVSANGENSLDTIYISFSFSKGTTAAEVINQIASAMGLAVYGIEQANVPLPNGFTFAGNARMALKRLGWFLALDSVKLMIDNGQLIIYRTDGQDSRFSVGILDYTSGLIYAKTLVDDKPGAKSEKRLEVRSILMPKIKPDSLIKINGDYAQGVFVVDKVQFVGTNFTDTFDCLMEVVE